MHVRTCTALFLLALWVPDTAAQVVFNEFNTGTPDWLELANCTPAPVDISGWEVRLWYATSGTATLTAEPVYAFPAGTIIAAYDFLVVQENGTPGAPGTLPQSISCGFNLYWTDARTHEFLLVDNTGLGIDYVYKNYFANPPTPNLPPNLSWTGTMSMQANDHHLMVDQDNDDAADWELIASGSGTPAAINPGQVTGPSCSCSGSCPTPYLVVPTVTGTPGSRTALDAVPVDTVLCTTDNETPSCDPGGDDALVEFTAPFDGTALVDTCTGATFDTVLAVLDGPCGVGSPEIACNDDSPTCAPGSEVTFTMVAGNVYTIVVDGAGGATGTADVTINLTEVPSPTCTLTLTATPPVRWIVPFDILPDSQNAPTVDIAFDYSTDAGATWQPATPAGTSANPMTGVPIAATVPFEWHSHTDAVGLAAPVTGVLMRATVTDGVAPVPGECQTAPFDVDNTALCPSLCGDCNQDLAGPTILDALIAAQVAAGLITPGTTQAACCDVNASAAVEIIDALLIAQDSAGIVVTLTCL
jgi:hypothetical protein